MDGNPAHDMLVRVATLAADCWAVDHGAQCATKAEYTRGLVKTAVTHLIDQGLLAVPDDIEDRLSQPIPLRGQR